VDRIRHIDPQQDGTPVSLHRGYELPRLFTRRGGFWSIDKDLFGLLKVLNKQARQKAEVRGELTPNRTFVKIRRFVIRVKFKPGPAVNGYPFSFMSLSEIIYSLEARVESLNKPIKRGKAEPEKTWPL
jgi:hypothetical protein